MTRIFGNSVALALQHAVTEFDRKAEQRAAAKGRYYNQYALSIMLGRVADCLNDMAAGATPRAAVIAGFHGPLQRACLKAIGEKPGTKEEESGLGRFTYKPAAPNPRQVEESNND